MVIKAEDSASQRSRRKIAGCEAYRNLESGVRERLLEAAEGCSIAALADAIGLNHESVRRAVRGGTIPLEMCIRVCARFEVSAEWLLFGAEPQRAPAREVPRLPGLSSAGSGAPVVVERLDGSGSGMRDRDSDGDGAPRVPCGHERDGCEDGGS